MSCQFIVTMEEVSRWDLNADFILLPGDRSSFNIYVFIYARIFWTLEKEKQTKSQDNFSNINVFTRESFGNRTFS